MTTCSELGSQDTAKLIGMERRGHSSSRPNVWESFSMVDLFKQLGNTLSISKGRIDVDRVAGRQELPATSVLDKQQVVVGILNKWVNLGTGWHPRLFVMYNGVLKAYKVSGPLAVDIANLLEALQHVGELYFIGAEVNIRAAKGRHHVKSNSNSNREQESKIFCIPQPYAEVHLQVANVRESHTDSRKLYLGTGTQEIQLRAETQEDRWVWIEALKAAIGSWQGLSAAESASLNQQLSDWTLQQDIDLGDRVEHLKAELANFGASSKIISSAEAFLRSQSKYYREIVANEEVKRRALLEIVYRLENEKRQLETAIVIEGTKAGEQSTLTVSSSQEDDATDHEEEQQEEGGKRAGKYVTAVPDDEALDDEFFECESLASYASGREGKRERIRSNSVGDLASLGESFSPPPKGSTQEDKGRVSGHKKKSTPPSVPDPLWLHSEGPAPRRRSCLPKPAQTERSVSLWGLIKDMVGKDLSRVCLPVYFNEPLSALQKTAEDLEYSELLDEAAELPAGSVERLLKVTAFAVSAYGSTVGRTAKPFNPLLGETFEFVCQEKGFRCIVEKVSHHPTIIALHSEGRRWVFQGDADVKSKFWGRSIELRPEGTLTVVFDDGDEYHWNKVTTSVNNLILGKIYVDHGGVMRVRNINTGLAARVRFKETGILFDRDPRHVVGFVEKNGQRWEDVILRGHWDDALAAEYQDGTIIVLWRRNQPPPDPTRYHLTQFAIELNELTPGLAKKVAPTDCRLRPDQSALEKGEYDKANSEKQRLEHKQRAARVAAERGEPLRPRWFTLHEEEGGRTSYRYKGGYWEERSQGTFTGCRDIFGAFVESVEM